MCIIYTNCHLFCCWCLFSKVCFFLGLGNNPSRTVALTFQKRSTPTNGHALSKIFQVLFHAWILTWWCRWCQGKMWGRLTVHLQAVFFGCWYSKAENSWNIFGENGSKFKSLIVDLADMFPFSGSKTEKEPPGRSSKWSKGHITNPNQPTFFRFHPSKVPNRFA